VILVLGCRRRRRGAGRLRSGFGRGSSLSKRETSVGFVERMGVKRRDCKGRIWERGLRSGQSVWDWEDVLLYYVAGIPD
jgi:hypothetical protein